MDKNFNLPPGVTLADLCGSTDTTEDYAEREYELADRWHDAAVDREAFTKESSK